MKTKILIIEDHVAIRQALKDYLQSDHLNFEIYDAASGEEGIILAQKVKPDIVVMDFILPGQNGLQTAGKIKSFIPNCNMILLTLFNRELFTEIMATHDIMAVIEKGKIYDELGPAIKKCLKRNTHICPA